MFDDDVRLRIDPYTRRTFLLRLERLVAMRKEWGPGGLDYLNDLGILFLDRAIAATVLDCQWVGAAGVAESITRRLHV